MAVRLLAQQVHLQMLKDQITIFETLPVRWNSWMGPRPSHWNCCLGTVPTSRRAVHCTVCCCYSMFFPPLLAESKLLRQKAQDTGLWQYVSRSLVYVDFVVVVIGGAFRKVLSGSSTLLPEWPVVNVNSLYRWRGQIFYRPLRCKEYLSLCVLCSVFSSFFFPPYLSLMTFSLAEHFLPPY